MANILAEVLNVNHNTQQSHFRDQINKVTGRIAALKTELIEASETVFVLADADIDRVTSWSVELTDVHKTLQCLSDQFDKDKKALENSSEEMDTAVEELDDCTKNIDILQKLVEVVRNIEIAVPDVDVHQAGRSLSRASDILQDLKYSFPAVEDKIWYKCLHVYVQEKVANAQNYAMKQWNAVFRFETNGLIINQGSYDIPELVDTIENTQGFKKLWTKFCDQIWQELLSKICSLDYTVQITTNASNNKQRTFSNKTLLDKTKYYDCDYLPTKDNVDDNLSLSDENENAGDRRSIPVGCCIIKCKRLGAPVQQAKDVFRSITNIISTFKDVFEDKWEVMNRMGETLSSRLCEALSTKCLKTLILKNSNGDMNKARQDLEAMHKFVGNLSTVLYFNVDASVFENIKLNFNGAFTEQLREDLIVRIRSLIKSDAVLHTVEVGPKESTNEVAGAADEIAAFHRNPMKFPKCVISKSVIEIVTLLKNHLENYPDDLNLSDNAYNLYLSLVTVPKNESEAGDLIPLSAVLVHNNSLFLSHHASVSFSMSEDKIPLLRHKASQAYSFMMRSIRTKLNGMISEAMRGLDERVKTSVDEVHIKFQVIASEFVRLDNLFKGILPPRVWKKTLATLVDHTVNEMCSKVLSWDDISAATAQELAESFTRFSVSVSELFKGTATSVREIDVLTSQIVSKWQRFRLLTFVITASMKEIEDKWVDGCGPLAVAFSGEEVRRLVRALFQNTDRRATFLASIK